jgi:hypothetical protein
LQFANHHAHAGLCALADVISCRPLAQHEIDKRGGGGVVSYQLPDGA